MHIYQFILLSTFALGCSHESEGRAVSSFSGIDNRSDAAVVVEEDELPEGNNVEVDCPADLLASLETSLDGDTLVIEGQGSTSFDGCSVHLYNPEIREFLVSGDGNLQIRHALTGVTRVELKGSGNAEFEEIDSTNLELISSGNGSIEVAHLTVDELMVDMGGTSSATLAGTAGYAELYLAGNAELYAQELDCTELDATLQGNAMAEITLNGLLSADVSGNATLDLWGEINVGETVLNGGISFH